MKALISIIVGLGFYGCAKMLPVVAEGIEDVILEEAADIQKNRDNSRQGL